MKRLIEVCVQNPIFVNILLAILLLAGAASAMTMIREMFPLFSADMVLVQVPYPGATPDEVEEGICLKLEEALEGTQGIKNLYTVASEGMGLARLEVLESAELEPVKDEITDAVNSIVTFPADAERPIITEIKVEQRVLGIAVYGDLTERQLKELGEQLKDELMGVDGLSKVYLDGARDYEISIEVSEERLRQYGLTLEQVGGVVRAASQNFPGGTLRGEGQQMTLRTMGRKYTGEEFAQIVLLAGEGGESIRLGQVATIRDGFVEDELIGRFNGKRCVMIDIYKTDTEDALTIADKVNEYLDEKNATLPPSVRLEVWADYSHFIDERLNLLIKNGAVGLVLVFALLWVFLDLRLAFWCSMGIPISLAGALSLMNATGQTINMISLFALIMILGIIVDDAIVVGESIYYHRRKGMPARLAAVRGGTQVAFPVIAAVLTTIIAFLPLMFVGGIMGKFIRVLPMAVIAALLISLVESILMLPAHLRDLVKIDEDDGIETENRSRLGGAGRWRRRFARGLERFTERVYYPFIRNTLSWRYVTLATAVSVLLLSFGMYRGGLVKYQFFPDPDTDYVFAQVEFPIGTPVERTQAAMERIEAGLQALDEEYRTGHGDSMIDGVYSLAGKGMDLGGGNSVGGSGPNFGLVFVSLVGTEERNYHYKQILPDWKEAVGPIAGAVSVVYQTPEQGPGGKPLEFALTGPVMDDLLAAAEELEEALSGFDGVYQVENDFREGKPEVRARLKPAARNLGLTEADLGQQLRYGFYGFEVMRIQRGRDDLKIWVRYPEGERRSIADLEAIRIRTPDGHEVPLDEVATLSFEPGYFAIQRKNGMRRVVVNGEVDTARANANEITTEIQATLLPELKRKYHGLNADSEGQRKETADSFGSLAVGYPLAMLGIYLILATMFRSYLQPLVIMLTIPFGLIGATAGHLVMNLNISMMSMFGMVALTGIVVNDSIVLIDAVNSRLRDGLPLREALAQAGARRFRAILLTTLTTSLGLMPIILERSLQAQFLIPMALSISAGVMFATVLTLVVTPCLLMILNDLRRTAWWLVKGEWPTREAVEPMATQLDEERRMQQELAEAEPAG